MNSMVLWIAIYTITAYILHAASSMSKRPLNGQDIRDYESRRMERCVSQLEGYFRQMMDTYTLGMPPWVIDAHVTPGLRNMTVKLDRDKCVLAFTERLSDQRTTYCAEYEYAVFTNRHLYTIRET